MFADQLRDAVEASPRVRLPEMAALLWRAYAEGHVSEAEAEALAERIEARKAVSENPISPSARPGSPRTSVGSRPVSGSSLDRRRRWAASGRIPPAIAARFTLAEQAVLSLVAAETARRSDCRLCIERIAATAGVSRSTVKNAVREARKLGLVTVEERKVTGFRNLPNIVRIVSAEWTAWLRLTRCRSSGQGGGVKSPTGTPTEVLDLGKLRPAAPPQKLPGGSGRPRRGGKAGIGAGGGERAAMR